MVKLPIISADKFGYDLNALADGMSDEAKLALVEGHRSACERRDWRRLLWVVLSVVAVLLAKQLGIELPLKPW